MSSPAAYSVAPVAFLALLCGCSAILVSNPPPSQPARATRAATSRPARARDTASAAPHAAPAPVQDTLDFALAFATPPKPRPRPPAIAPSAAAHAPRQAAWVPSRTTVRVLLLQRSGRIELKLPRGWQLRDARNRAQNDNEGPAVLRAAGSASTAHFAFGNERGHDIALPCTLICRNAGDIIGVDSLRVRGMLIVTAAGPQALCVVNALDVEQYLRGVVPREIGRRPAGQREALKAQAIAARTYVYRMMMDRERQSYDVVATVADQVYGGAAAEDPGCDSAIAATRGQVLIWEAAPIVAYYHSTCGGSTAAPEDVWGKPAAAYLGVFSDRDPAGTPYCAASSYSRWTVEWTPQRLSELLRRYGAEASCNGTYQGALKRLAVDGRFACGRIRRLIAEGQGGTAEFCGDRARFALRRDLAGAPILPGARFEIAAVSATSVRVSGSGFGHGVGMCQMGALGRATAGQSVEQILTAYYPNATLVRIDIPETLPRTNTRR